LVFSVKIEVFWDFAPCRLVNSWRFGRSRAFIFGVKQSESLVISTRSKTHSSLRIKLQQFMGFKEVKTWFSYLLSISI